ncbi:hypothetical protein ACJX0J_010641, partial [Zea mays]
TLLFILGNIARAAEEQSPVRTQGRRKEKILFEISICFTIGDRSSLTHYFDSTNTNNWTHVRLCIGKLYITVAIIISPCLPGVLLRKKC